MRIRRLQRRGRAERNAPLRPVPSQDDFQSLIEYECAIADRYGLFFSVIVFDLGGLSVSDREAAEETLRRALSNRLRATDILGWIDGDQVGALLPRATAEAAARVAIEIKAAMDDGAPVPRTSVFTFPTDWTPTGGGPAERESDVPHSVRRLVTLETPAWKRCADIAGAGLGLMVIAPALLAIAVLVKLTSPGPVLYRQVRAGLGGKPFAMYKFRTMCVGADAKQGDLLNERSGPAFKMRDDPRVTRLGRVLRRWSLDELPQLFNVLIGEMSLVGPRPLPIKEAGQVQAWHRRRLDAVPGITGLWQIVARHDPDFDRWVRLDIEYMRRRHPGLDLQILARTIPAVLAGRGAC